MLRTIIVALGVLWLILSNVQAQSYSRGKANDTIKKKSIRIFPGFMDNKLLEKIIKKEAKDIKGKEGTWQLNYHERLLMVITDQKNNRMRIISPIIEEKDLKTIHYTQILKAQFDRALDVKYALYNKVLWSVFAHPLKELTSKQVRDALKQVFNAAQNFGGSYQSTDLIFGSGDKD